MDILPLEDGGVRFMEVPSGFYDQLIALPEMCDPDGDPVISSRLYPHPVDDGEPESLRADALEDWADFVKPELEAAYDSALLAVMETLAGAKDVSEPEDEESSYEFEITGKQVPDWYQVLNRARIVLAIKHRLPISEFPPEEDEKIPLQRLLAAHLTENYAGILELFAYQMTNELPEEDSSIDF